MKVRGSENAARDLRRRPFYVFTLTRVTRVPPVVRGLVSVLENAERCWSEVESHFTSSTRSITRHYELLPVVDGIGHPLESRVYTVSYSFHERLWSLNFTANRCMISHCQRGWNCILLVHYCKLGRTWTRFSTIGHI